MHVSGESSERRPRRAAFVLLALLALLAVVAIASSGHIPIGSTQTRRPAHELADTVISLVLVLVLAGSLGIFYVYYLQRTNSHERARKGRLGGNRVIAVIVVAGLLLGLSLRLAIHRHRLGGSGLGGDGTPASTNGRHQTGYTPRFATIPVTVILGAAGIAGLAAYLSYRARRGTLRPPSFEQSLALTLADILGETLDDLRAEPDPRIAVIAAYARLERTLAASGLPRRAADAPGEYLQRILLDLEVSPAHVSRLTQLFEHAKFSRHEVGPEMKEEAIVLLESIRTDLQAAETAREATRLTVRTTEQPA